MRKSFFRFIWVVFVMIVLVRGAAWGARAYVTDAHEIAIRTGPSAKNKVVAMLPPSTAVETLKSRHDWSLVRMNEAQGTPKEGWVQSKFLVTDSPETLQAKSIEIENAALKEAIALLEKEKSDLSKREKELQEKLDNLKTDHEALKSGSANYLQLKEEYDSLKTDLTTLQGTNQTLVQENENLKISQKVKWFVMGALVLFCGWSIGILSGRHQRKQRPSYRI